MALFILASAYLVTALGLVLIIDRIVGVMFRAPDENVRASPDAIAAKLLRRVK
ncbi:hypothetical protein [Rhizobium tubonense]|uniref:hypothetical protein n=1 Tax=Rhizobium tubonense TaxID=484088 RepID=UPI0012B696C4|nr:hypothetical protein [Rhizobium tubonense]